jgi:phosphoenolpyruvate carboxylase
VRADRHVGGACGHRFPYIDPLNHLQVGLLRQYRADERNESVLQGIQLTINGISAAGRAAQSRVRSSL